MADPVEAFIDRVRSVEPLPRGSNRRLAIRQKIAESESALRMDRDAALALPAFRQRAKPMRFILGRANWPWAQPSIKLALR